MLKFHTVDVFTDVPFTGNSLAIVEQADDLTDSQMQTMAREFNLPETIFIKRPDYRIRQCASSFSVKTSGNTP